VPAADEKIVLVQTSYGLVPIGWVQSALKVLDDAPNQREGVVDDAGEVVTSRGVRHGVQAAALSRPP
jgi:hypothetical protein